MTRSPGASGWDDGRLAAAFAARAATVSRTPPDLVTTVVARLAREPRVGARPRSLGFVAAAATVIVVLGLGGAAILTLSNRPPVASSPSPSGTGPVAHAARELGLTPIGVEEAVRIRATNADDRELLVSGYLSNDPTRYNRGDEVVVSCDDPPPFGHLLAPNCTPLLMAQPESIVTRTLTSVSVRAPSGPAFHPVFDLVGLPPTGEVPLVGDAVPSPITVVGHFHDRRASSCLVGAESLCGSSFVVDRIVEVDGVAAAAPSLDLAGTTTADAFRRAIPAATILSLHSVARGDLETLEPSFIDPADIPAAVDADRIWVVVALDPPDPARTPRTARTFLIGKDRATVVEMTRDGPVTRPETVPSPTPSDAGVENTLFGAPIITVSEAIDHRDQHLDDTELVVRGFGWAPGLISCPAVVQDSPARAQCPTGFTWLAQVAPPNAHVGPSIAVPTGPAINLLIRDETAMGVALDDQPRDILVIGHFDDHRAGLCTPSIVEACRRNFLVDAIVNANFLGYSSVPRSPFDGEAFEPKNAPPVVAAKGQVERVASDGRARAIFTVFPVPGSLLRAYEPGALTVPALTSAKAVWIVRYLDEVAGRYVVRTKLIIDGTFAEMSANVYEATSAGAGLFIATVTPPPITERPTVVMGLDVIGVADALARVPQFGKEELAVHGWYVTPDPAVSCPGLHDAIRPVRPPTCFEGRPWLLEKSEQLWSDPIKVGIDRQPTGASLNPIIPSDVPFDVPNMWSGNSPDPIEVVVLGHFSDPRVTDTYAGNEYFVVDALVWQGGHDVASSPVVRLTPDAAESPAAVLSRIERELGPANASWITVVRGSDLPLLDPEAATKAPELARASAVWVVRRLVDRQVDGISQEVVASAFTADDGDRVWSRPASTGGIDLATTIDVQLPAIGKSRGTLEIADQTDTIVAARIAEAAVGSAWRPVGPAEGWRMEVSPTADPHELAIRWTGDDCATTWQLAVLDGPWLGMSWPYLEACPTTGAKRTIVLTFDHPVDVGSVTANDNTSGG